MNINQFRFIKNKVIKLREKIQINLIVILLLISLNSLAQNKEYVGSGLQVTAPVIDGIPDDEAWKFGIWSGDFVQYEPHNGSNPTQKTEFILLYDDKNIYMLFKVYDNEPHLIEKRMSRRDGWEGDRIAVEFDSYNDMRTAFGFGVSASGVKSDGILSNNEMIIDFTWDPIWYVKTSVFSDGWIAEMKIPLSQLRFNRDKEQIWGFQIIRYLSRKQETSSWSHIPESSSGWVSHFGKLKGLHNLSSLKQVEIAPYISCKMDNYTADVDNPFSTGRDYFFEAGVDGKIGITNDFTLDFAINPDFGQVEADPSEVNLTAYESYFQEKRPFFVEGNNIIDFPFTPGDSPWSADNLFYSRRIGREPQYFPELDDNEFAMSPSNTRILGALKLSGKTKDGWSVGILESVTNKEKVEISKGDIKYSEYAEPLTNYFLTRVQRDLDGGNTIMGGMVTSTYRDIKGNELNFLNSSSLTGGLDFAQFFKDKKYSLWANIGYSYIEGSKESILEQQLSSRRYFQRPDADYITLDSSRVSLAGHAGRLSFSKNANSGLRYTALVTWRSPGFESNDMGFMRRANSIFHYFWVGYAITKPFLIFRRIDINANEWAGFDFGGTNTFFGGNLSIFAQFSNLWTINGSISREGLNFDDSALRGGPGLYIPGNLSYNFEIGSNSSKSFYAETGFWSAKADNNSGSSFFAWTNIVYRPHKTLEIGIQPNYSENISELQYVDQQSVNGEDKYIFAKINQKTVNLVLRINYNITPDLTLQYYSAPFISAGYYSEFKSITDPLAYDYNNRFAIFDGSQITYLPDNNQYGISESGNPDYDYIIDNPEFNFRQFRSNMVLRWEYTPGSVLFLVWSQSITDNVENGEFNYFNDLENLFKVGPSDVFMLKLSYRFNN